MTISEDIDNLVCDKTLEDRRVDRNMLRLAKYIVADIEAARSDRLHSIRDYARKLERECEQELRTIGIGVLGPNQKAWVFSLRMGGFRQCWDRLQDLDGACCCLGVACIVAERRANCELIRYDQYNRRRGRLRGIDLENDQPGIKTYYGFSRRGMDDLIEFNTKDRLPFTEIANQVEEEPERFFEEVK